MQLLSMLLTIALTAPGDGQAEARLGGSLEACVPADAMAAYMGRPSREAEGEGGGSLGNLSGWLFALNTMGVLPEQGRVAADAVATLPLLARSPHAIVLLDATARRLDEGGSRLDSLQAALVIEGRDIADEVDQRIRQLLSTYTDSENGRVEEREADGVTYHRLTDGRLKGWAVAEWAPVGERFVIAFGEGAFERMVAVLKGRTAALPSDGWYQRACRKVRRPEIGIEAYVDMARIRARLGDVVEGRPAAVWRAVALDGAERLLWTAGYEARALRSEVGIGYANGRDRYRMLSGRELAAGRVEEAVPGEAGSYAAVAVPLPATVYAVRRAYLATQSPGRAARFRNGWGKLEEQYGFDVETGLIDQLGGHVVFHTYPAHPLGVPVLGTLAVEIAGDSAVVRGTLDKMMTAWRDRLNGPDEEDGSRFSLSPRVERADDGVWYLQLGFLGPAMAVTDGWIVVSFSPEAVRVNVRRLQRLEARR